MRFIRLAFFCDSRDARFWRDYGKSDFGRGIDSNQRWLYCSLTYFLPGLQRYWE